MPPAPAGLRPNPISIQRWSTQTLILLSTSVGLSTYIIGFASGHKAGLKKAALEAPLAPQASPTDVTALNPATETAPSSPPAPISVTAAAFPK
ncbi:hypothetical protein V8E36_009514 [Tilletia maclaganii]